MNLAITWDKETFSFPYDPEGYTSIQLAQIANDAFYLEENLAKASFTILLLASQILNDREATAAVGTATARFHEALRVLEKSD